MEQKSKTLKVLRLVAILEGISYLLLFAITMPLKYYADLLWPNEIMGMAHGVLFIAYVILVFMAWPIQKWSFWKMCLAQLASLFPFCTFIAEKKMFQDKN